jgi:hypothetical protein
MFDFLYLNLGNSKNESEGNCANVYEEKTTSPTIDLMDGHTIPSIQDVGASLIEDPSYHFAGQEMECHFCRNDNWVKPQLGGLFGLSQL